MGRRPWSTEAPPLPTREQYYANPEHYWRLLHAHARGKAIEMAVMCLIVALSGTVLLWLAAFILWR